MLMLLKTASYLYLIHPSTDDASWLRGRVHAHLLRAVHPRISLETCEAFGVPRISQVVREVLAEDFVPEIVSRIGKDDPVRMRQVS